jgi:hypothetical protein
MEVLKSKTCSKLKHLIYTGSENPCRALISFLTPPASDSLSKKREEKSNPQLKVMLALRDHLIRRVDLPKMLASMADTNARL